MSATDLVREDDMQQHIEDDLTAHQPTATITWYNDFVAIHRHGTTHTYAIRQLSNESIRRLWAIQGKCTLGHRDFYKIVHIWK